MLLILGDGLPSFFELAPPIRGEVCAMDGS
jgi:hypothetical protein